MKDMKKEYIKPEMEVEVIETESLLLTLSNDTAAMADDDANEFGGPLMEGKERNDNWGGLLW